MTRRTETSLFLSSTIVVVAVRCPFPIRLQCWANPNAIRQISVFMYFWYCTYFALFKIKLHGEQQQPSPSSLPRHLTSSSRQSSPSSSSLSNSFSSPSPSKADIEKCESSTQTDECGFSAAAASVPSFEFDQSSRCSYDHQVFGIEFSWKDPY